MRSNWLLLKRKRDLKAWNLNWPKLKKAGARIVALLKEKGKLNLIFSVLQIFESKKGSYIEMINNF